MLSDVALYLVVIGLVTSSAVAPDAGEGEEEEPCTQVASALLQDACTFGGLQLTSKGGTLIHEGNCNVLLPKQTFAHKPRVLFGYANRTKSYTVVAIDPDAPRLSAGQFYLHWLKVNVPGTVLADNADGDGLDIVPYTGPNPPTGTGDHRYMFLVYEQRGGDIQPKSVARKPFNMDVFSARKMLCGPQAGMQFRARY